MLKRKHLVKIRSLLSSTSSGINLAQSILCDIAFGKNPYFILDSNLKAQQAFSGLRRYKFIRHAREDNIKKVERYVLTSKGENRLRKVFIDEVVIKNPIKWDGKWHLIIYDLPLRFKKAREAFRWKLKDLGFYQFQKSAWIYPYPCERELLFVADFFGVRNHIGILEINKILDDSKLRSHFSLP